MNDLKDLFVHFVKDMYFAEKKILKTLPKMARKATSPDLKEAFQHHQEETESHVERLEQVLDILGLAHRGVTCEAIKGILEEGDEIMSEAEEGETRDAGMIAAAQAVEHYEMTRYGTMIAWAETLGMSDAAKILSETLGEERAADEKLTSIASGALNKKAA